MRQSIQFYNFKQKEKVVSIGCGGGLWEAAMAFENNDVAFHLQDIDAELLNETELANTLAYLERQYKKPTNCTFNITIGTEKQTSLPSKYFDKILIINSFHEFEYQKAMLEECKRILKPNGYLFIEEQLASYSGQLHEGCEKRLFLKEELIYLLAKEGFNMCEKIILENKILAKFT